MKRLEVEEREQRQIMDATEEIRDELLKIAFGVWDHMKNRGDHGADNRGKTYPPWHLLFRIVVERLRKLASTHLLL